MPTWQPSPAMAGPLYGKDPWPLKFHTHNFSARCWNVLACTLVYCGHEFGSRVYDYGTFADKPVGPPPWPDWKDRFDGNFSAGDDDPIMPVEVAWTALDGSQHRATLDLDTLFRDRLVLHHAKKEEIPPVYLEGYRTDPVRPSLLVELNDRTINIYMRAMIVVGDPQDLDDIDKRKTRYDLVLAWTHTY